MKIWKNVNFLVALSIHGFLLPVFNGAAQQIADTTYNPAFIIHPEKNKAVTVAIDEGHNNFHTAEGRYKPFASILRKAGYQVRSLNTSITENALKNINVLVIANAVHRDNANNWSLPNPSAFTATEIKLLNSWVTKGGALFIIADHMPFAGAAADLARSFGFVFYNGFAIDTLHKANGDLFCKSNGSLAEDELTRDLDSIVSFTGQGFEVPASARSILNLNDGFEILLPQQPWVFDRTTERKKAGGLSQLAALDFKKGKVLVSGEAAMFSAQVSGGQKVGMNSPRAPQNYKLLLNTLDWLSH
jgi:hypothetical protein